MSIELTEQQQAEWEKDRLRSLVFTAAEIKSALIELFGKPFNHTLLPEHKPDCPLILKPDDGAICHCFQEYQRQMTTGFIYLLHPLFRRTVLEAWEKYSLNNTPQLKKYLIREIVNEIMNYRPIKIASVSSVDYAIKLGNPTATKGTSFEKKAVALMGGRTEIRVVATVNVKVGGKIHPKGEQFDIPVDRWLRHEWLTACRLTKSGPEAHPGWEPIGRQGADRVRRLLWRLGSERSQNTGNWSAVLMTALCDELKVCRTGKGYLALREQLRHESRRNAG